MFNHRLSEVAKIIQGSNPVDVGTGLDGRWISLRLYQKFTAIVNLGAVAAGSAITVQQAKSTDPDTASAKALPFTNKNLRVNADISVSDDLVPTTPSGTNAHTPANANGQLVVLEFNSSELDMNNGFDCVRVQVASDAGTIVSITYILSGSRYAQQTPPSAFEDLES